nr:RagB/SusD family nutrient uptake outer membrane protein [Bacteroides intestinalis]
MKYYNYSSKYIKRVLLLLTVGAAMTSCEDFLDQEPLNAISPESYYKNESHVEACANVFYGILPSHSGPYGTFGYDTGTDNQFGTWGDGMYATGLWKVGLDNGSYNWDNVRNINFQLNTILERFNNGQISGNADNIKHYIGEMYFFRALQYFNMLQSFGDLPIVKEAFPDDESILVAASQRMPRNQVARFILEDLDNALAYMKENFSARRTRISPDVVNLLKSRVALYEGSWLTNFAGTPFVPNGEGWPGKEKDYNAGYQFPAGSLEAEAKWFFQESAKAAEIVAEKHKGHLVKNTGNIPQSATDPENPYFKLFGNTDMSVYPEVLLWREFSSSLSIMNSIEVAVQRNNYDRGLTRSMVEGFLMEDGKPIYAQHNGYSYSDQTIAKVRANRDPRLVVFLKEPGQINCFLNMDNKSGNMYVEVEPKPELFEMVDDRHYSTGYVLRKGGTFDKAMAGNYTSWTASITYRATEALLNYIEAQYMISKNINDGHILEYWKLIRETAGFQGAAIDPNTTIGATDMSKEKLDWGAYTAGQLIDDVVLYNIRRERRCELMAEGLRSMDLHRWRSYDQMKNERYHVEGFHLWNSEMTSWYNFEPKHYDGSSSAIISSPIISEYVRPLEKNMTSGNSYKDGLTWHMAHYLQPLPIRQFQLTASDHVSVELSPLYQNPYWPTVVDHSAEK